MPSQTVLVSDTAEIHGVLNQIPALPDPQKKPLFNAENVTVTGEGRVFVTGSQGVYEIVADGEKTYRQQEVPITARDVPQNCFMNGITAQGKSLYLACTHIYKGRHSPFPSLFGDLRNIDQNSGILLLGLAELAYNMDSYIVRADLGHQSLSFSDAIQLPGKCFANGLDADEQGSLYTANELLDFSGQLLKVSFPQRCGTTTTVGTQWHRPLYLGIPNGLKVRGDYVYYTCTHLLPTLAATLQRARILPDGSAGKGEIVYLEVFSVFDDFAIVDDGFVIANITGVPHSSGGLLFVTNSGRLKGVFRNKDLKSPSSVKVVKMKSELFDAGDVLLTEKGRHCVSLFRPDEEWRAWLTGSREGRPLARLA
jgi:hypothetical protein